VIERQKQIPFGDDKQEKQERKQRNARAKIHGRGKASTRETMWMFFVCSSRLALLCRGDGLRCVWQEVEVVVGYFDLGVTEGDVDAAGECP
jgi:hypothetical protein